MKLKKFTNKNLNVSIIKQTNNTRYNLTKAIINFANNIHNKN